jgi:hypothetical protein
VVAFEDSRPSFAQLQQRMHVTTAAQAARLSGRIPASYLIFDVLHAAGHGLSPGGLSSAGGVDGRGVADSQAQMLTVVDGLVEQHGDVVVI